MRGDSGRRGQVIELIGLLAFRNEFEQDEQHLFMVFIGDEGGVPEVESHVRTSRLIRQSKK